MVEDFEKQSHLKSKNKDRLKFMKNLYSWVPNKPPQR